MANKKKNRIVELDPEHLREVDGVVFDLDSFARHCAPHPAPCPPAPAPTEPAVAESAPSEPIAESSPGPAPVFLCDPVHIGWYPIRIEGPSYPVMAGAVQPGQQPLFQLTQTGSGSFATSYLTSFLTSFTTSWQTSWYFGSGSYWYRTSGSYLLSSGLFGSFSSAGTMFAVGGYGLELI